MREHNESSRNSLLLIQEEWNGKFGGNPKMEKLMKKMMIGDDGFADDDADDLWQSLKDAIFAAEKQLENMDRLVEGFVNSQKPNGEKKVYA